MSRLIHWKSVLFLVLILIFLSYGRLPIVEQVSSEISGRDGSEFLNGEPERGLVADRTAEESSPDRNPKLGGFGNGFHERLYLVKSQGYIHAGQYAVPGYYTLMLFSSAWCLPCKELRKRSPVLLDRHRNLIIVDIDIGEGDKLDPMGASLLADLGENATLPAALLFNPFGLYMNRQEPSGVAGAICGYEEILTRIEAAMTGRKNRKIIPMDGDVVLARLSELQNERQHYSLHEADRGIPQDRPSDRDSQ